MGDDGRPAQEGDTAGLVERLHYIIDTPVSAFEAIGRLARLTNYDIHQCIEALTRQPAAVAGEAEPPITLASLRADTGMSLREVKTATGGRVGDALLSQYETGKIKRPSATVLVDLAGAYGVPVNLVFEAAGVNPAYVSDAPLYDRHARPCATIDTALPIAEQPTADAEIERNAIWNEIINTPETADFMAGVPIEAAHQRERWSTGHDASKSPFDWFWLIGYLAQKAADAATRGDADKAKHHTISTAAALANWHAALTGADTSMRPGIGPGNGGEKPGSAYSLAALASIKPSEPT